MNADACSHGWCGRLLAHPEQVQHDCPPSDRCHQGCIWIIQCSGQPKTHRCAGVDASFDWQRVSELPKLAVSKTPHRCQAAWVMLGQAREPESPMPNSSRAMVIAVAESSDDDGDSDQEIALTVSMKGNRGCLGITADTIAPAGASKLKFKQPLSRSIVEIELYHSSNGHIGSNMLIRPRSLSPEPHGWRAVECQARAGGLSPPFTKVQCYGVSQQVPARAQHLHPPSRPCPPAPPPAKRRRCSCKPHTTQSAQFPASLGDLQF